MWLNRITDTMRRTVRSYFSEAILTYEDNPREKWIFDYPAQVSLCGTQIWWTTEVNMAFARLDEGYENAIKDYNKKQVWPINVLCILYIKLRNSNCVPVCLFMNAKNISRTV